MKIKKKSIDGGLLFTIKKNMIMYKSNIIDFLLGTLFAIIITFFLLFIEIWQFIIIPGIIAGLFNKRMKRGILSGALSISIVWGLYILEAILSKNAYINIDQFASLIFGTLGFGWILILLIFLFGILFGALGGAIGSGVKMLIILNKNYD